MWRVTWSSGQILRQWKKCHILCLSAFFNNVNVLLFLSWMLQNWTMRLSSWPSLKSHSCSNITRYSGYSNEMLFIIALLYDGESWYVNEQIRESYYQLDASVLDHEIVQLTISNPTVFQISSDIVDIISAYN